MQTKDMNRRHLLKATVIGAAALAAPSRGYAKAMRSDSAGVPAALGGRPVRTVPFPRWPRFREADEKAVLPVLRSGVWSRAKVVDEAERRFAKLMGAKYCVATCNGTNALITSVRALDIGAGDEVITTPYTFVASIHPILLAGALPVFADIDPETWQIDPVQIEARISKNAVAIMPVHIIGGVCDMDQVNALARKHNLKVIEDACEAHGGEWKGQKVGTLGDLGCFSFQTGKSLTCGEGGAILGRDEKLMDRCYSFHNLGRSKGSVRPRHGESYPILATKCRMAEYQASILITQMETFDEECKRRSENAAYLTERLEEIPGIIPRKDYAGVTRKAFYYYGFRYKKERFDGLSRDRFIAALGAEGIPASAGLGVVSSKPMNKEGCLEDAFRSKAFQRIYSREKLAGYQADNECPHCDRLIEETVGFHQGMLLGARRDMDDIANAIAKVYDHRRRLRSAG
jgi:dTDP-4-amino-4,6-dideoxygalactose transaminase